MSYLTQIYASARRWASGMIPIRGARATADGSAITTEPTTLGADGALRSAAYWACTRLISCSVGSLPAHVFEETATGKIKAHAHPYYRMLTKMPNPWMTLPQYVQATVMHLLCYGNAYTLPDMIDGQVAGLWPLPPERVSFYWQPDGAPAYRFVDTSGRTQVIRAQDLLHFRIFTLDGFNGLAPLDYHRLSFGFETASQAWATNLYANGGRPAGVLEYPQSLTSEQKAAIRSSWTAMHAGPMSVGRTAILDGGVKYQTIAAPPEQLQYIESQKFSVEQIARIFGVAPHLIGSLDKPTYASVEQQSLEFLRYTIQPIVINLERTIETHLLEPPFMYRFNLAGFERADIKTRYSSYAVARQWGFLSVNDILDLEDRNRIGEAGDVYLQPLNMVPAGEGAGEEDNAATRA